MSLPEHGLPASFFTGWRAVAIGLFVGGMVLIGNEIYMKIKTYVTEPTTAPACYGNEHVAGKQSIPERGARDNYGHSVDDRLTLSSNTDRITFGSARLYAAVLPKPGMESIQVRNVLVSVLPPATHIQSLSQIWKRRPSPCTPDL